MNANVVMREKSRHRETEIRKPCLTRNDTVNQRIQNAIAKEITEDLLGHPMMTLTVRLRPLSLHHAFPF